MKLTTQTTPLKSYLDEHGITHTAFAQRIGVHQSQVSRLCKFGRAAGISLETAAKIERATDGAVPATSWVSAA